MADDIEEIEDMLEAPYKNAESEKKESTNGHDTASNDASQNNETNEANLDERNVPIADGEKKEKSKKSRKDRSRSKDRSSREKSSRKRSRSRSGSRSKKSKRSKSRDRKRGSRSRSRDRRRKHSRSRSRSRSRTNNRRRSSRTRSRSRSGSAARHNRNRRDDRRRQQHRSPSPASVRKPREPSPELTPEERDQRTVFCMQLAARIRPRDLEEFFSNVGKVRDVRLITDPRTKRSKGIAYVEFRSTDSVPLAIALTGQRLLGVPIIVKLTQAEKNRMPFTGPHIPANLPQMGPMKLYIGNLNVNITEDMLKGIFEPFGEIDAIVLARDEMCRSKGYGFIQFGNAEDGKKAIEQLNNFELAGKPMKVSMYLNEKGVDYAMGPGANMPISDAVANLDKDELDRAGVNLGTSGKLALMAKLAQGTGLELPPSAQAALNMSTASSNPIANGQPAGLVSNIPTQCFLLSNMFDLEEEQNKPNWQKEIRDDVIQECSKYGGVCHIHVDELSIEGNIYIKCPTIAIAMAAMSALNGRFFGGKLIQAHFVPPSTYHTKFPDSQHCARILSADDE